MGKDSLILWEFNPIIYGTNATSIVYDLYAILSSD